MRYMKQFGIILAVTCVGEILHSLIDLPIPGSIYGLVIMFVLLCTKVIKLHQVKDTAQFLIDAMPMMFIPAGVALMTSWDVLQPILIPILIIMVVSTVFVMVVTGLIAQGVMKARKRLTSRTDEVISRQIAKERLEEIDD